MIITEDQFNDAYNKLPYVIREFLAGDELSLIVEELGKKYNLHVDLQGALERETSNMLLGLINPTQFVAELKTAGIPAESIMPISQEVNEKVFIPLHERMRRATEEETKEGGDEAPQKNPTTPVAPAPTPVVPTPTQVAPPPATPPAPVAPPVPPPPVIPKPEPLPVVPPPPPLPMAAPMLTPSPATAPESEVRTMANDMAMVRSGVEHPHAVAEPVAPAQIMRATPPPQPPPLQPTSPIAAVPVSAPMSPMQPPPPVVPKSARENRQELHEVLKSYGVDPYREPIE